MTDTDLCDCGHPGYDGHDMRSPGYPCLSGCEPERCVPERVRASVLRDAIAPLLPADAVIVCEQTGGSTATIYVNPRDPSGVGDDFGYDLAIGPGTYDWSNSWNSTFHYDELSVGRADTGYAVESLAALVAYIKGSPIA